MKWLVPPMLRHIAVSPIESCKCFACWPRAKTMTQIAAELSSSVKTVSTHRSRMLEKMRLQTNAELIRYAIWHRLVD
jgi:two-component system, NarL family, invasion response regulator UvrY